MATTTSSCPSRQIAPLGEARSNVQVFSALAQRMGFGELCFRDTEDALIDQALRAGSPEQPAWMAGMTAETLKAAGGHQRLRFASESLGEPFRPYADGIFPTPSGKIEFYSHALAERGRDPLPGFVHAAESRLTRNRRLPARVPAAEGRQLHELDLRESSGASEDGGSDQRPPRDHIRTTLRRGVYSTANRSKSSMIADG